MHIAGEAPPELSPLDAFAMQSRMLARQLQESTKDGNRVSRLPPLTLESPLMVQGRSDYFRSLSQESPSEASDSPSRMGDGLGLKTELEDPFESSSRPKSMHPRMSRVPPTPDGGIPSLPDAVPDVPRGRQNDQLGDNSNIFGGRQERSPSPLHSDTQSQADKQSDKSPARKDNASLYSNTEAQQRSFDELGLAPPRPFFPKRSSSALSSSPPVFSEDDATGHSGVTSHPSFAPNRKLSSGSAAFSVSTMPTGSGSFHRSPSIGSDSSALPRPSFNFSRPLSRAGTPSFDMPSRQASSDSQPSFVLADESAHTPVSMHSEAFLDQQADDGRAGGSYVYSKFTLPRGKALQRDEEQDSQPQLQSHQRWEQAAIPNNNVRGFPENAPPSPPTRPSSSSARVMSDDSVSSIPRPSMEAGKASLDISRLQAMGYPSPNPSRPSLEAGRRSEDTARGRTFQSQLNDHARGRTPASTNTSDSASTIRPPPTARSAVPTASEMSAEEHLAKGIECHESGSVNESTYHFRLAARQNEPTAMLLYALACRHGWGMRPNQREGVQWLRKAAEYAGVLIADEEDQAKEGKRIDFAQNKARKAQFALSIYELGVSHMNGWGIEQDKALALRCFEIAGSKFGQVLWVMLRLTLFSDWGDVDALAEAGFCYAQGVGCKKNLKKSAKFYRMAEAKGMSMIGNSW